MNPSKDNRKKKSFEYKTKYFSVNDLPDFCIQGYLNDEGKDRWELVYIIERKFIKEPTITCNYTFIFKKEI